MSQNSLMNASEVAQLLSVSEASVKRFAREKLLQTTEINGELMFEKSNVLKFKEINDRLKR